MEKKRKRQIRNINSELPPAIIEVIFSKLPFFNLPSCRLVCREWNNLVLTCKFDPPISISNLFFARIFPYYKLHCVDFDPKHLKGVSIVALFNFHPKLVSRTRNVSIVNSCNGLLCLSITRRKPVTPHGVCILNPMTNEYIKLPISKADRGKNYCYGLGFSPRTKQYKIARLSYVVNLCGVLIEIFAFGTSREWTTVSFVPFFIQDDGVYFNGGLYFIVDNENAIYRLDIEDEKFEEISSPQDDGEYSFLGDVNGTLYLTIFIDDFVYHVWKMGEDFSWIKAFVVEIPSEVYQQPDPPDPPVGSFDFQLIKACEDGKILCLDEGLDLMLYNPESETMEKLTDQDGEIKKVMYVHHIDSFSFNSLHKILAGNG